MKWLRTIILFDKGNIVSSADWSYLHNSYKNAIEKIDFPEGTGKLKLRKKIKTPNSQWLRNGVVYLKIRFLKEMIDNEGWTPEVLVGLSRSRKQSPLKLYPSLRDYNEPITSDFGGFDFFTHGPKGKSRVAIEWETGNISSSHRSMNKLAIALEKEVIDIGILIVPSRALYEHLTDRIGNIGELSGYLSMWASSGSAVKRGLLAITVVEHDELTDDEGHPYLPTGNDGRAREGASKGKK